MGETGIALTSVLLDPSQCLQDQHGEGHEARKEGRRRRSGAKEEGRQEGEGHEGDEGQGEVRRTCEANVTRGSQSNLSPFNLLRVQQCCFPLIHYLTARSCFCRALATFQLRHPVYCELARQK